MELIYQGKHYHREPQESVLDCLLKNGVTIPHSCKSGVCCSCMMKTSEKNLPAAAQTGIKDSLKEQGYFLSCVCKPEGDLEISDPDETLETQGEVQHLDLLNDDIIRVRITTPDSFSFRAGQYVSIVRKDGLARSYSIASLPESGYVELHVRILPNGKMSSWLKDQVQIGEKITLRGPSGHCFYSTQNLDQPLLLAGTGTGLAPLYGILQDALKQGHRGPIWLFHGARHSFSIYLKDELEEMTRKYPHLHYYPCALSGGNTSVPEVPLDQHMLKNFSPFKSARVYLCGDPNLVNQLRKRVFLAGASSKEIFADAFLPSVA